MRGDPFNAVLELLKLSQYLIEYETSCVY